MPSLSPTHPITPRSAKTTRMLVEATLPLLVAAIALPLIGSMYLIATGSMTVAGPVTTAQALMLRAVQTIPSVLMAFAMFALRKVLIEYERGQFLSTVATTNFQRVGYYALAAMLVKVFGVPATWAAILGDLRRLFLYGDTFDVSLLLFGALLAMVGAVFARAAAAIKAENDEIV